MMINATEAKTLTLNSKARLEEKLEQINKAIKSAADSGQFELVLSEFNSPEQVRRVAEVMRESGYEVYPYASSIIVYWKDAALTTVQN